MKTPHKIYATVAVLALGGVGLYLSRASAQRGVAAPAPVPAESSLPAVALSKGDAGRVTKIELTSPDDDDKSRLQTIRLERLGQDWEMTAPLQTVASASKVGELIGNLETLHLWKLIDPGTAFYDRYDLTDEKAVHIVASAGPQILVDLFCGKSSADGQLVRLAGKDGIFSLVNWGPQGYAGFLYTRDLRSWRETSIFKFQEDDAVEVEITNRNGVFLFSKEAANDRAKNGDRWLGVRTRRLANGRLGRPERGWPTFDESKVEDLLRVFRALSADDFGPPNGRADSGVDDAEKTGGVVRIRIDSAAAHPAPPTHPTPPTSSTLLTLRVGKLSKSTTRWAIKDSRWAIKDGGDGTLYALSPWTAGWATADAGRFERTGAPSPR